MEFFIISMLNGLSYGLLLFMLSSGLTLIFSMMGVLNFAHASFYMIGAYFGYTLTNIIGFWPALIIAPFLVGGCGVIFERLTLRKVHKFGHVPELLVTFGSAEMCKSVDDAVRIVCSPFPATRAFMMFVALLMLLSLWLLLTKTRIGLVIQAALTHPETVESLGHNVPRVFMMVFGAGTGLAGLAGVIGGSTFVTEPAMAATVGSVIFVVVVVGGMGSLSGAFLASVLIGVIQTFAIAFDYSFVSVAKDLGFQLSDALANNSVLKLTVSQVAPILPYLFLVLILIFRPKGLLGTREG